LVSALLVESGQGHFFKMNIAQEYQEEREKIELNRTLDWSTFSKDYIVAGEKLKPMTVQVWFDLLALKSPMIYGDEPTVEAIVDYIWRNSVRYKESGWIKDWRVFWLYRRVFKSIKNTADGMDMVAVLCEHLKTSLDEFPTDQSTATSKKVNSLPVISGEASMIDELASRYSIHPEDVLAMTLRRAFSLQRTIRMSTIPGYKLLEPDSLRAIKSKYLNSLNNGK
jgi:hypothetical protein